MTDKHLTAPKSREELMVVIKRDQSGRPTVWCDPDIADLVAALTHAGLITVASCCGHGYRPGMISLKDGRQLFVATQAEADQINAVFPLDINGDPVGSALPEPAMTAPEAVERLALTHARFEIDIDTSGYAHPMRANTHAKTAATLRALSAERDKLQKGWSLAVDQCDKEYARAEATDERAKALETENARLRAALEYIQKPQYGLQGIIEDGDRDEERANYFSAWCRRYQARARAALRTRS